MDSYRVLEPMEFDIEGIPLAMPSFGRNEIKAMDSLLSGWITMGKKVKTLKRWSNYVGSDYGIAVNSDQCTACHAFCYDRMRIFETRSRDRCPCQRLVGLHPYFQLYKQAWFLFLVDVSSKIFVGGAFEDHFS